MRLKLSIAAMAACAATALTAGAASAAVHYYPYGTGAPVLPTHISFSADMVGSAPTVAPTGWTWSGNGLVENKTHLPLYSEPAVGPSPGYKPEGTNFMTIEQGHTESLTIPSYAKATDVELYVGSLDSWNKVTFDLKGGSMLSYTGAQLASMTTAMIGGNQYNARSNGIFNFTFNAPVTGIVFQSPGGNSFEIASIWLNSVVPEPAEWVMLILGVAMVGAAARRKRSLAGEAALA